jgi:two-component system, NarL family, sensor histidine kinase DegS
MADYAGETYFDDPKQEIIEQLSERMTQIKRRMTELKNQIEQTKQMVRREQERYTDIATALQTIDANLDSTPREDIRDQYKEAIDTRFRLTTMSGQLEKFESQYSQLETEQQLLADVMHRFQGVTTFDTGSGEEIPDSPANINIVRIVQAQEEERQRLARQMHDGPAQSLTNFILQAEICQRLFDRNPERAGEELNNLKNAASVTFQKVRDFIFDLRPMMLDDLGVVPTVRRWVDSVREKNDIEIDLELVGEERRLDKEHKEVMIFRAIQDLVGYARDYATASELRIKLDISGSPIQILVHDNGRAINVEELMSEDDHHDARSQGIITLKEKFELVRGNFQITSNETEGTLVRLDLPAT